LAPEIIETLEISAEGRESLVLDLALPVLAGWAKSVRVLGFRSSMGVSGLLPREAARLRTLGLATSSRATGIFEGANDFRLGFKAESGGPIVAPSFGVEADLGGHALAPVVADLSIASFGLREGGRLAHELRGFTHVRGANAQGYGGRILGALGREFGLDLKISTQSLGFEPQGMGIVRVEASRSREAAGRLVDWKGPGELRAVHVTLGGVRPKPEQLERLEAELRDAFWESRRIEPSITRLVTSGVDLGAFLQLDVECEQGGATFMDVVGRSSPPLPLARRASRKAFGFLDSGATCDDVTGVEALAASIATGGDFEISLVPSDRLSSALGLLRDIGAYIEEEEAPGLLRLKTRGRVTSL